MGGQFCPNGIGDLVGLEAEGEATHSHLAGENAQALNPRAQERGLVQPLAGGDLRATACPAGYDPFTGEVGVRAADGVGREAQLAGKIPHRWQMIAGLQGAVGDAHADPPFDLHVDRRRIIFAQGTE